MPKQKALKPLRHSGNTLRYDIAIFDIQLVMSVALDLWNKKKR